MPSFCTEEAHEAWCDREGLPEDAVPEHVDEEPTERVQPLTIAAQLGLCMVCNAPSEGTCAPCEAARLEGRR